MTPHTATQSIAFRPESGGMAGDAGVSLLVAMVLLACALGIALFAQRKGWLARWTGTPAAPASNNLRVLEVLRLSRKTVLFRVGGEREYLVIESETNARLIPLPGDAADGRE